MYSEMKKPPAVENPADQRLIDVMHAEARRFRQAAFENAANFLEQVAMDAAKECREERRHGKRATAKLAAAEHDALILAAEKLRADVR